MTVSQTFAGDPRIAAIRNKLKLHDHFMHTFLYETTKPSQQMCLIVMIFSPNQQEHGLNAALSLYTRLVKGG